MEKKVLRYAKEFEDLGHRLKQVVKLTVAYNGKVVNVIGLTYGFEGLTYAMQIRFDDPETEVKFEKRCKEEIKGFRLSQASTGNPLTMVDVFLDEEG